jgi:butyryl-CoA dehydrogenase
MKQLIADMSRELQELETTAPAASATRKAALEAVGLLKDSTDALVKSLVSRPDTALAVSVPYLMLCGYVIGGWLTARASAIAARNLEGQDRSFYEAKLHTARFYAEQVLPTALALARVVQSGAESVVSTDAALI